MALGEIYLGASEEANNLLSPYSRTLGIGNTQLSRDERTASGKLVRDTIATKKTFTLSYELIDNPDLEIFKYWYDHSAAKGISLWLGIYFGDGSTLTEYYVLMQPIDYERVLMFDNGLWGNLEVVLEEI